MSHIATTPWTNKRPDVCGEYLTEHIGEWFPKGDVNNISHRIVSIVFDEDGKLAVLDNGNVLGFSGFVGYKWAKIFNAS